MLRIMRQTNKDRYRHVFCDYDFYSSHQTLFKLWKTRFQSLNDVEKIAAWVAALGCLRRAHDWFGGIRKEFFLSDSSPHQHLLTLQEIFQDTPVLIPQHISPQMNLTDFLNQIKIKAFPESCHRSLCFMMSGRYPLDIVRHIPTPAELLRIQTAGRRIVSLNENFEEWTHQKYSERDHLGFLMHDLIHADHFFYEPKHQLGQLGFFAFIQTIISDKSLEAMLCSEDFKTQFEYVISDMNSHPVHLFQTLKTLLYMKNKNDFLSEKIWKNWCEQNSVKNDQLVALTFLNTKSFSSEHAKTIELLCIGLVKQISI